MKTKNYYKIIIRYLKREMDQNEVTEFEKILKNDSQLQKDFLVERSIFIAVRDMGRDKIRNRFAKMEMEGSRLESSPRISQFEEMQQRMSIAAFMHQKDISSSSLPVSDDTIKDFLAGEDKENNSEDD